MSQSAAFHGAPSSTSVTRVRTAWEILSEGAPSVAQDLLNISHHSKNDLARVRAAEAVLNRVGLPEQIDVGITATHLFGVAEAPAHSGAVDTVRKRLLQLRASQRAAEEREDEDGVVIPFHGHMIEGEVDADS